MALGDDRTRPRNLARAVGGDEHSPQPWVNGKTPDPLAEGSELRRFDEPKPLEQRQRRLECGVVWPFEPVERARISAPGDHVEHGAGQIDAPNLRLPVLAQSILAVPQPAHNARAHASGTARTLLGGVRRDAFQLEAVNPAAGVVAGDLVPSGIDDRRHARHGDRRLGDVRRDDDPPARRRGKRGVLSVGVERTVQRHDIDVRAADPTLKIGHRASDLWSARQEAQHVAVGLANELDRRVRHALAWRIGDLERVKASGHIDDGTAGEERGDGARVERRRHDHDSQVVAREPRLFRQRDRQVGVHAALVEFVEHNRAKAGEQRIGLQARGQHAFGDDEQSGVSSESALEPDLPADLAAERPAALARDARW